jgi:hypothetical protein
MGDGLSSLVIVCGALALIGAHLLRAPDRSGLMAKVLPFLTGLAGAVLAIKFSVAAFGLGRTTEFDGFVNHALNTARTDDAPIILFSGASFSRNAIDETRLTAALQARGYRHRVVSFSLEAASLVERDTHVSAFLKAAPRPPAAVFIEIAEITDRRPTFVFGNSKFSARAIDQFDARASAWSALGLAGGGCTGAADCIKESGFLALHAALNAGNVGLIGQGEITRDVPAMLAFDGPTQPREDISDTARRERLGQIDPAEPRDGLNWAMSFRRLQRERLAGAGVAEVAYYFPPVLDAGPRAYASSLCAGELAAYTCITPDDAVLLTRLDQPVWLDKDHLLDSGAAIYTEWLVDQIIASGVLEAGR